MQLLDRATMGLSIFFANCNQIQSSNSRQRFRRGRSKKDPTLFLQLLSFSFPVAAFCNWRAPSKRVFECQAVSSLFFYFLYKHLTFFTTEGTCECKKNPFSSRLQKKFQTSKRHRYSLFFFFFYSIPPPPPPPPCCQPPLSRAFSSRHLPPPSPPPPPPPVLQHGPDSREEEETIVAPLLLPALPDAILS